MIIKITRDISIDESELDEQFLRASGPGGQNINKVSTAVRLRFNAAASPNLPVDVRARLMRLAGRKASDAGDIVILAQRHRTQKQNRADARDRLVALVRAAAHVPKSRKKTRPSAGAERRRIESKIRRGEIKRSRSARFD